MNPLKLFRKLIKMVRGGAAPWQIVFSCMLGVMLGMSPSFNGLVFAGVVVFALLNLSLGLMLIGVVTGTALRFALAPITFEIGYVLIHQVGLEGMFASAYQTPFVALMGLDLYCLVGGIPIGLAAGALLGWLISRTIKIIRIGSIAAAAKSVKVQTISSNFFAKIILRILFGKQKKTLAELLAARHPIIRKAGVVLVAIIVGLVIVFEVVFIDQIAKSALVSGLETASGAEVNVKSVDLSLTGGRFEFEDLQMTDPDKPTHNMYAVSTLSTDLDIAALLTKRVVVDEIKIGILSSGVKRETPGKVYRPRELPEQEDTPFSLSDYFKYKDDILKYLAKVKEYLENQDKRRKNREERTGEETRDRVEEIVKNSGYLKASAASLLIDRPMVTIRKITIKSLPIPNVGDLNVTINELSSDLALNEKPMDFIANASKTKFHASGMLDFVNAGAMHKLKVTAPNLAVEKMGLTDKCPMDLSGAKLDLGLDGKFNRNKLALPIMLALRDLKPAAGGKGILGLDAATSERILKSVTNFKVSADIRGPIASPTVKVDTGKTLAGLKEALIQAGKDELANMAGEQLKKILPDGLPIKIPGINATQPADMIKEAGKGIGDMLNGKTPTSNPADLLKGAADMLKGGDEDETEEKKDPAGGLLKRL